MTMFTIPALIYGRVNAGNFYVGLGLGVHAWALSTSIDGKEYDLGGANGINMCSVLEPGYAFPINENLTVTGSLSIYSTAYENESETDSSVISFNIGAEYAL